MNRKDMKKIEYIRHQPASEKLGIMNVYYKSKEFRDQGNIFFNVLQSKRIKT